MKIIQQVFIAIFYIGVFAVISSHTNYAIAQSNPPSIPSTVDPGQIIKQFDQQQRRDDLSPDIIEGQDAVSIESPDGAEELNFVLNELRIVGSDAYQQDFLEERYEEFIGQTISVAEIFRIAADLTQFYRNNGYVLARAIVPPQEIDGGIVTIEIVEGQIDEIRFKGLKEGRSSRIIKRMAARIQSSGSFDIKLLERQLLLLNRLTGYRAVGVLEPLSNQKDARPGAVALKLVFSEKENRYSASFDNYGSRFVGPWQGGVTARLPRTGFLQGETTLSAYTSTQFEELMFVSLSDRIPIDPSGLTLNTSVKYSNSQPGDNLETLELESDFLSFQLGLSYPIILSRLRELDVFTNFEYTNSKSDILQTRFFDDRLRVVRLGLRGQYNDFMRGFLNGEFVVSKGLNILGSRESGSLDLSREQGRSDFYKLKGALNYSRSFANRVGFSSRFTGQYSPYPLLSSEEIGYGGYTIGRGYNNSEITGDAGAMMLVELSYFRWAGYSGRVGVPGVIPFVFYDIGKVWNRDTNVNSQSGASAGMGFNLNWGQAAQMRFTAAKPLTRSVENPVIGNGKSPRLLMSIQFQF